MSRRSYAAFCQSGAERWTEAVTLLDRLEGRGPAPTYAEVEALTRLHTAVLADYAVAAAHFPNTEIDRRLRVLVHRGHRALQPPRPSLLRQALHGLRQWPGLVRAEAPSMGVALAIFVGGALVGAALCAHSDAPAMLFVGNEQLADLRDGHIWTNDVHQMPAPLLAASIGTNNAGVGLVAWASGALVGLGPLYVLFFNGAMVGVFVVLAHRYGVASDLYAFTAAHGPLELTLIIVSGGAGLSMLRHGLVDDGRPLYTRLTTAARRSLRIVLGTLPGFALLGAVEGFVSPDMGVATAAKAVLGFGLLAVFLGLVVSARPLD